MKQELAEKILEKVKTGYNQYALEFSRTRDKLGPDAEELAQKYIKDGERVLDVGCGNGRLLDSLKDKKVEYVGIDNSEALLDEARKKLSIINYQLSNKFRFPILKFQTADVLNLPFEDNKFDIVFCKAVLHHIPARELQTKALGEIYRVLKPGGKLIMTNWNLQREVYNMKRIAKLLYCYSAVVLNYLVTRLLNYSITKNGDCLGFKDLLIPWGITGDKIKRYYYAFSLAELGQLVKEVGFKIDEAYYTDKKKRASFWKSFWKRGNLVVVAEKC